MFQKAYFTQLQSKLASYPQAPGLIAVTKYCTLTDIEAAYAAGLRAFGESRVQDLQAKAAHFATHTPPPRWHFIGHLQRNKLSKVFPVIDCLHSLDSAELAQNLVDAAAKAAKATPLQVYIQVNLSGQAQKYGFALADLDGIKDCASLIGSAPGLRFAGFMGMSSADASPQHIRAEFLDLRRLRDSFGFPDLKLSMGMSQDYELALEAGSDLVRIGSALFKSPG